MILLILNAVFCMVISYNAFAVMQHRHPPKTVRDFVLQVALGVMFASFLLAGILPLLTNGVIQIWTVFARFGLAVAALCVYDEMFARKGEPSGIRRHWQHLLAWRPWA